MLLFGVAQHLLVLIALDELVDAGPDEHRGVGHGEPVDPGGLGLGAGELVDTDLVVDPEDEVLVGQPEPVVGRFPDVDGVDGVVLLPLRGGENGRRADIGFGRRDRRRHGLPRRWFGRVGGNAQQSGEGGGDGCHRQATAQP
ncbi:hypothetical protein [Amycolatopsis sp. BJA-103]|uniref:hypothetical protein n=1 Tax=Amycolatopsis sp. BJA-103 TaxID=1911175 RepID=UPI00130534BE